MLKAYNRQTKSMSSLDFDYLRQLVRSSAAVALDADKEYLAELYLTNVAEQAGFDSIIKLVEHLKRQPFSSLHVEVIESLLNYETSFFRDIYPFEVLKNFVLPEIIKRESSGINIWCAASSSGQEPYSIAMLLHEHFPTIFNKSKLQLIASDVSSKVLARAREGIYNQIEIRRGLPATLQKEYFHPLDNQWQIDQEIRKAIDFRSFNLLDSWSELPQMDIIFLRNVLIYFDTPTKKIMLFKVRQLLKPNGYLFLGGGETTLNLDDEFERIQFGKGSCYQVGSRE